MAMHLQSISDRIRVGSLQEPDNEKVVRGSRDGFTENLIQNTALVRRRLRTEDLRFEMHKVTVNGKTDIAITYMQGAASEEHLTYIRERLDEIKHDGLTMTDKSLEEFLFKQGFHPMPFVRFTERPDICAAHLLEGHICHYCRYVTFCHYLCRLHCFIIFNMLKNIAKHHF